ncbi:MAG: sigma-70 family RNA polymerase sigma factor [Polyangiaceae bacterium]
MSCHPQRAGANGEDANGQSVKDPSANREDASGEGANDEGAPAQSAEVVRALVENHRAFLAFLEKRVGRRDLAEDILQDAFARGLSRVQTLRDDESAVAWFYRTLRNAVVDRYRRSGAESRALEAFAKELPDREEPPEDVRDAVCQCVSKLAATLKPEYAHALELVEVRGLSVKELAEQSGITSNNAAQRVFRARNALRKQVVASCGTCAEHGCLSCSCGNGAPEAGQV